MNLQDWLDEDRCPTQRPPLAIMARQTQALHETIDQNIRNRGVPYLHPSERTVQLDLFGSSNVVQWQESKASALFEGETCWSALPQLYARYGTESGRKLIDRVCALENARCALICDSGMQATAITLDVLMEPGAHAVMFRQVYNKTAKYLDWLARRCGCDVTIVDDGDLEGLMAALRPQTRVVFAETFTNPLMRAMDLDAVPRIIREARHKSPHVKLVVDSTIATSWGTRRPLLDCGIDVVLLAATKAIGGQDLDLGGLIATNDPDVANAAMDLIAMRGGILDWRRADVFLAGLERADTDHARRCESACKVAAFLDRHPRVQEVFHPSLPGHPDADAIARGYRRMGSLLSFRLAESDEREAKRFSDALATCIVVRYALSFDGLTTKVNHHRSVSEYFTSDDALRRQGIDGLVRLGLGLEHPDDICAALNWALYRGTSMPEEELSRWRAQRLHDLGLAGESSPGR